MSARRPLSARNSLSSVAYERIEDMIVRQDLPAGSMVTEAELSAILNCGRTPLREALLRLKHAEYIHIHPRRGIFVTHVDMLQQLQRLEARRPLEITTARLAASRATPAHRVEMGALIQSLQDAADSLDRKLFYNANKSVHLLLAGSTQNAALARTIASLHTHSRRFWYTHITACEFKFAAANHANVLLNIIRGDEYEAAKSAGQLMDYLVEITKAADEYRIQ